MDSFDVSVLVLVTSGVLWWVSRLRVMKWFCWLITRLLRTLKLVLTLLRLFLLFPTRTVQSVKAIRQQKGALRFVCFIASVVCIVSASAPWILTGRFVLISTLWTYYLVWERRKQKNTGKIRPIATRKPQKEERYATRHGTDDQTRNHPASESSQSAAYWTDSL